MSDWSNSQVPKTCALIESLGIDPSHIVAQTMSTAGYETAVFTGGKRVWNGSNYLTEQHEWPSLADDIRVIDQFIQEGGYRI